MDLALRLVAAGPATPTSPPTPTPLLPKELATTTFHPPLYDTFATITRRRPRLSTATREPITNLETHMQTVADRFDPTR
jgi:hypothetical protein